MTDRKHLKIAMNLSMVITLIVVHMLLKLVILKVYISNTVDLHIFQVDLGICLTVSIVAHGELFELHDILRESPCLIREYIVDGP